MSLLQTMEQAGERGEKRKGEGYERTNGGRDRHGCGGEDGRSDELI